MGNQNPFRFGGPVTGEFFGDRQAEIDTLCADLRSGQNVVLLSPRRFGKTSLIQAVLERLRGESCLCAYLDLFPVASKARFAQALGSAYSRLAATRVQQVARALRDLLPSVTPKIVLKGEGTPEFDVEFGWREQDLDRLLDDLYDAPQRIAEKRGQRVVVAFDEFQEITSFDGEQIERALRSKIQFHREVAYLFAGSKRHLMDRLFSDRSRPFYRSGKTFPLGKIPREEFAAFIAQRFQSTGFRIAPEQVENVLDFSQCLPYTTQLLCHEIWNVAQGEQQVTVAAVEGGLQAALANQEYAFTAIWDSLSPKQRNLLIALAQGVGEQVHAQATIAQYDLGAPATVSKSLKGLQDKELIEKENGRWVIADPLLALWVREMS